MVSLGQYVINCWFTTGGPQVLEFRKGQKNSTKDNSIQQQGSKEQKVSNVEGPTHSENVFSCQKKGRRKYWNAKPTSIEFSQGEKPLSASNNCYCMDSKIQFNPQKDHIERTSRINTFVQNNTDNGFCEYGGCYDKKLNNKNCNTEQFCTSCGVVPFFNNLFSCLLYTSDAADE